MADKSATVLLPRAITLLEVDVVVGGDRGGEMIILTKNGQDVAWTIMHE